MPRAIDVNSFSGEFPPAQPVDAALSAEPEATPLGGLAFANGITAPALMAKRFLPIQYVVPGYIPEGATLLAGAPKLGKSWMALGIAIAVASGGVAFDSIACEAGDVLLLALEDNERRLQARIGQMQMPNIPERLRIVMAWPTLDDDCIDQLECWLQAVPRPRLIIIDVLARIKGRKNGRDAQYDQDYGSLARLQSLAGRWGVAILIIHHTRKGTADEDPFDEISGTRGLAGAVDTALILRRDATGKPMLYGRGRDLRDVETAMEFDQKTGFWRIVGSAHEAALTSDQRIIIELLGRSVDPMTPTEIADALGKERTNTQHHLGRLMAAGKVTQAKRGHYVLSVSPSL
jgi:hypothetical protein